MSTWTDWVKEHPLAAFFVLANAISWAILVPLFFIGSADSTVGLVFVVASAFGPALAALTITGIAEGMEGIRHWIQKLTRWRVSGLWYAIALICPFLLVVLGYAIYLLVGGAPLANWEPPGVLVFVATVVFLSFFGGGQEELGWRGFALPRLQARYNALTASLILSVVWLFWHIPVFLIPGTVQSQTPFVWYSLLAPAVTILLTWIFNSTGGSIFPAMLFHAGVNAAPGLIPLDLSAGPLGMYEGALIAAWLLVALVVLILGPERLAPEDGE